MVLILFDSSKRLMERFSSLFQTVSSFLTVIANPVVVLEFNESTYASPKQCLAREEFRIPGPIYLFIYFILFLFLLIKKNQVLINIFTCFYFCILV